MFPVQVTYITFFNSRVVGSVATKLANKFIKTGYIQVQDRLDT